MIPAATLNVGDSTHKLRLTTGALMRFEEDNDGQTFDGLLDKLIQGSGGIRLLVSALAAGLGDGKGIPKEEAMAVIDAAGGARQVVPFIAEAIAKAFPAPEAKTAKVDGEATAGKASPPAGA
mgnify:CR=1 FL=1